MTTNILTPSGYGQHYIGDTGNYLVVQFLKADNITPYSLVGVDKSLMTFRMKNNLSGLARNGVGSWGSVDDLNGIAQWLWDALDVAQAGIHHIQTTAIFATGPITFQPVQVEFIARL